VKLMLLHFSRLRQIQHGFEDIGPDDWFTTVLEEEP